MPEYAVRWEIDVEANSPEEAVEIAKAVQTDENSEANVFEVIDRYLLKDGDPYPEGWETVDLTNYWDIP